VGALQLVTVDLIKCIRSLHHQDLFRLRQGTQALSQTVCKKLMDEMVADGSNAKAAASTLQLLLICILDNGNIFPRPPFSPFFPRPSFFLNPGLPSVKHGQMIAARA